MYWLIITVIIKDKIYLYEYIQCCLFLQRLRTLTRPSPYWGPALIKHRRIVYDSGHIPGFEIDPWGSEHHGVDGDIKVLFCYL